jgi:hypothetical protein
MTHNVVRRMRPRAGTRGHAIAGFTTRGGPGRALEPPRQGGEIRRVSNRIPRPDLAPTIRAAFPEPVVSTPKDRTGRSPS